MVCKCQNCKKLAYSVKLCSPKIGNHVDLSAIKEVYRSICLKWKVFVHILLYSQLATISKKAQEMKKLVMI